MTQKVLIDLRAEVNQHQNLFHSAESKAGALRKQLAAVESVMEGKIQHIIYLNAQVYINYFTHTLHSD